MKPKFRAIIFPKPYSNGEFPLFIQIYLEAKRSYISAGYCIPLGAWNKVDAEVWESMPGLTKKLKESLTKEGIKDFKGKQKSIILLPNASKINSDLREIKAKLEEILKGLEVNKQEISAEILKRLYENKDKNANAKKDFLQYITLAAERKFQNRQIRTAEKYEVMQRKLKAFRKDKPLPIDELTTSLLKDFQLYLVKGKCHVNYIHVNLKVLRTIIQKEAIKEDKILAPEKNPFLSFTMPKVISPIKEKLDEKEIEKLEAVEYTKSDINFHIRNAFLFSFYSAGIRIGDLLQLKWCNIKEGRLEYNMGKTGKMRSILLIPQTLKILDFYKAKKGKDSDFIFPFLDNNAEYAKLITPEDFQKASPELLAFLFNKVESRISVCNAGLKKIAIKAGIKKKLQNHISRHSFADKARKKNQSIYDISKMLGHSDIKVTQGYINSLDIEAMDNAMNEIFSKSPKSNGNK
jgi:integrase/recombinase XerD